MHDGMPYDPIQCQGQGHKPFKVANPAIFKTYAGKWPRILKPGHDI